MQESNNNVGPQTAPTSSLGLSIAIVIAALIVGGTMVYTNRNNPTVDSIPNTAKDIQEEKRSIPPVTEKDHIIGDINAPIIIVEYSDMECPFCVRLHNTLQQVTKEYTNVAWVYRHMPLHRQAPLEATATECAAELGGKEMFWSFINKIYEKTPGNDRFDTDLLFVFAKELGLDQAAFTACLERNEYATMLQQSIDDGFAAMAFHGRARVDSGTPFSVIVTRDGKHYPVFGAQPIEVWRQMIDRILKESSTQ